MRRLSALIVLAVSSLLAGCATPGSPAGGPPPPAGSPSAAAAAGSPSAAAGSPSAAAPPCTTHACIASDAEQSMVGTAAKDGSVVTKTVCFKSSVRHNPGDTYTVSCDVTYTDGTVWNGLVTILMDSGQVSWQPESEVS